MTAGHATAEEDEAVIGCIEDLADRLALRSRSERDVDLAIASDLLRLMALAYAGKRPCGPDDDSAAANNNAARGILH